MTLVIAICFTPHLMINQATTSRDRQQTYDQQFKAHEILEAVPEIDVPSHQEHYGSRLQRTTKDVNASIQQLNLLMSIIFFVIWNFIRNDIWHQLKLSQNRLET